MKLKCDNCALGWLRLTLSVLIFGVLLGGTIAVIVGLLELAQHRASNLVGLSAVLVALRMREVLPWSILGTALFMLIDRLLRRRSKLSPENRTLVATSIPFFAIYAFLTLQVNLNLFARFLSEESLRRNTVILLIAPIAWWVFSRLFSYWVNVSVVAEVELADAGFQQRTRNRR